MLEAQTPRFKRISYFKSIVYIYFATRNTVSGFCLYQLFTEEQSLRKLRAYNKFILDN